MPHHPRIALAMPLLAVALQGCVAKTLVDVATAPVRGAAQVADWATTSQDEADRNRGRELREREERLGKLEREYPELIADCDDGDRDACSEARASWDEMQAIRASLPAELPKD